MCVVFKQGFIQGGRNCNLSLPPPPIFVVVIPWVSLIAIPIPMVKPEEEGGYLAIIPRVAMVKYVQ